MSSVPSETPVADALAAMTAESLARCDLDPNSLLVARIAALAAIDAPAGLVCDARRQRGGRRRRTVEQVQNILIGIAPVIGTPRTLSAAMKITEALGITLVALEELEADERQ